MSRPSNLARTPGGLYIPLRATLRGRVRWQTIDERGVPEIPRSPSGFAIGPLEGVEQPNLITNQGLDWVASYNARNNVATQAGLRRYLAVGTGSTEPDVTDTTLVAEAQRAASAGTFGNGTYSTIRDGVANVWRHTSLARRVVVMSADRNLTEFGLSPLSSGSLAIRELFRDELGDPVTISLLNGKSILLSHTLTFELPGPAAGIAGSLDLEEYDAANALVGTTPYTIVHGGVQDPGASLVWVNSPFAAWNPWTNTIASTATTPYETTAENNSAPLKAISAAFTYSPTANFTVNNDTASFGLTAYSSGTYTRTRRATLAAGQANIAQHGYLVNTYYFGGRRGGYVIKLDSPASYTKVSTDTLRVGFVVSWARAPIGS